VGHAQLSGQEVVPFYVPDLRSFGIRASSKHAMGLIEKSFMFASHTQWCIAKCAAFHFAN